MGRLTGIGVLVTRPAHQAEHLCQLIEAEGGAAVRYPALEIKPRPDRAAVRAAVGPADFLFLEIDGERGIGAALGVVEQILQVLRRHAHGQHAVLEAVVVEDVGEARRDDAADAEIQQRPGRMLPRGAAAEIGAGHQDRRLAVGRAVQHELRLLAAIPVITHLVEQVLAQAGSLDGLQELLGNDHVGVDIDHRQGRCDAGQTAEFLHLGASVPPAGPAGAESLHRETGLHKRVGQRLRRGPPVCRRSSHAAPAFAR